MYFISLSRSMVKSWPQYWFQDILLGTYWLPIRYEAIFHNCPDNFQSIWLSTHPDILSQIPDNSAVDVGVTSLIKLMKYFCNAGCHLEISKENPCLEPKIDFLGHYNATFEIV